MPSAGAGATRFTGLASLQATRLKRLHDQPYLLGDGAGADSDEDERQQHSTGPRQQADHYRTLQRLADRDRDGYSDGKEQQAAQGDVPAWPRQHHLRRSLLLQQLHPARAALLQQQQSTKQHPDPASASSQAPDVTGRQERQQQQQQQQQGQFRAVRLPWPRLARLGHDARRASDREDRREVAAKLGLVSTSVDADDSGGSGYGLSELGGDLSRRGQGYGRGWGGGDDDSSALRLGDVSGRDKDLQGKYMAPASAVTRDLLPYVSALTSVAAMLPAAACPRQLLGSFSGGQQLNLIKQLHQAQDDVALLALASYVTSANRLAGLQDESLFSKHVDLLHKVHTRRGTRFQLLANSEDRRYRRALQDRRFAWTIGTQQNVATLRRLVSDVRPELLGEGDTDWAAVLQAAEQGNEDAVHVARRAVRGLKLLQVCGCLGGSGGSSNASIGSLLDALGARLGWAAEADVPPLPVAAMELVLDLLMDIATGEECDSEVPGGSGFVCRLPLRHVLAACMLPPCALTFLRNLLTSTTSPREYAHVKAERQLAAKLGSIFNPRPSAGKQQGVSLSVAQSTFADVRPDGTAVYPPPQRFSRAHIGLLALLLYDKPFVVGELVELYYGMLQTGEQGPGPGPGGQGSDRAPGFPELDTLVQPLLGALLEYSDLVSDGEGEEEEDEEEEQKEENGEEEEVFEQGQLEGPRKLQEGTMELQAAGGAAGAAGWGLGMLGMPSMGGAVQLLSAMQELERRSRVMHKAAPWAEQVRTRTIDLLVFAAVGAGARGAAMLGCVHTAGGQEDKELAQEVAEEVAGASERVAKELLPVVPVGLLLFGCYERQAKDGERLLRGRDKWCESDSVGLHREVMQRLESDTLMPSEWEASLGALRPGLLEHPASGRAWRAALEAARASSRNSAQHLLVKRALVMLTLARNVPTERLMPLPCALAGLVLEAMRDDAQKASSTSIKADRSAVSTAFSCLVMLSYVPPDLDTSLAPEPAAETPASQAAPGGALLALPPSCPAEAAEPAADGATPTAQQEGQEEREQAQPREQQQAQQQQPQQQKRPCPICESVAAAGLAPHERVALGLLQQMCRMCSDSDLYGAFALAVREVHQHRQTLLARGGRQGEAERDDGDAAKQPRTACGATLDSMRYAAKLHATSAARPERREEFRRLEEGAGRDVGCAGVTMPAATLPPPPPPPPPAARVDVQQGALGRGTVWLHERMSPEEVLSALLCTWLAALKRGQLVSWEQQGEADSEAPEGPDAHGQQQEGRERRGGQEGQGPDGQGGQERREAASEQQEGQAQQGRARPAVRVVVTDPSLLVLQMTVMEVLGERKKINWAWQPAVDAHLANVLLPCDTPVTDEACYNPPPGAPALVVLDLHTDATHGTFPEPAKAVMRRYRLDRVTGNAKVPKFSDAFKRLREALVDKPRVSATWMVAEGVGGLQRSVMLAAKVRRELVDKQRDLTIRMNCLNEDAMSAAEGEQLERRREEQRQRDGNDAAANGGGSSGGGSGRGAAGRRVAEPKLGSARRGGASSRSGGGKGVGERPACADTPWMHLELRHWWLLLVRDVEALAGHVEAGALRAVAGGSIKVVRGAPGAGHAEVDVSLGVGIVATVLRVLRHPGCVVREHVRAELLLQEVELGRVDRPVAGREEARAAEAAEATRAAVARAKGTGGGEVKEEERAAIEAVGPAGKVITKKELVKLLFAK